MAAYPANTAEGGIRFTAPYTPFLLVIPAQAGMTSKKQKAPAFDRGLHVPMQLAAVTRLTPPRLR
ncbi:MAG: hypothetical protein QM741_14135 [Rudaea sp.]|uniref:hypothetical protein n=1 Tax=Rudaea sp. TaxID=2136325 RepID=UPI0039E3FED1